MRRRVADRGGFGVEGRKTVCTKGQRIKGGSNPDTPQYTGSWTCVMGMQTLTIFIFLLFYFLLFFLILLFFFFTLFSWKDNEEGT